MEASRRARDGYGEVCENGLISPTKLEKALQLGLTGVWGDALATRTSANGVDRGYFELLLTKRGATRCILAQH